MKPFRAALVLLALAAFGAAAQQPAPTSPGQVPRKVLDEGYLFNIVDWDGGQLPKLYERSDQLPLSLDDIRQLSANKFGDAAIIKMLEERRCACDASVDALIGLKKAGVSEAVIAALSLHALPPNRGLNLKIALDFEGAAGADQVSNQARKGYLYLIIPDGDRERVFFADLQSVLAGRWQHDALVDNTDMLLAKKVRRVAFEARVPLKVHEHKKALVFTSTRPDIYRSADIPPADRAGVQTFEFDYPTSSLQQNCTLQVLYRQDAMLPDQWHLVRSHFECEWD
ncbi:MAG: hypothetical protein IT369_05455 [Candidatus Latescibacteria bacterium]|nr:hypothetical protein [Candidatus Latescibacterota bacterium]